MDALLFVPEGKGNVLEAVCITDTCDAVLSPSKRSGPCGVVGEVLWGPVMSAPSIVFEPVEVELFVEEGKRQSVSTTHDSRRHHRGCSPLSLQLHQVS